VSPPPRPSPPDGSAPLKGKTNRGTLWCTPSSSSPCPRECDVTFNLDGHLGVSVVLSFLLVFRADLAYKRFEQGKRALGDTHSGLRNLNIAFTTFLRVRPKPPPPPPPLGSQGISGSPGGNVHSSNINGNGSNNDTGAGINSPPSSSATIAAYAPYAAALEANPGAAAADAALASARMARDRMELFRLTNLLFAFVRHAVRGQRHGYWTLHVLNPIP